MQQFRFTQFKEVSERYNNKQSAVFTGKCNCFREELRFFCDVLWNSWMLCILIIKPGYSQLKFISHGNTQNQTGRS